MTFQDLINLLEAPINTICITNSSESIPTQINGFLGGEG